VSSGKTGLYTRGKGTEAGYNTYKEPDYCESTKRIIFAASRRLRRRLSIASSLYNPHYECWQTNSRRPISANSGIVFVPAACAPGGK